jgi:ribosomal protein S7
MSRRNISKKRFPEADSIYNSYLVSLLITRILKSGKKLLLKILFIKHLILLKKKQMKIH